MIRENQQLLNRLNVLSDGIAVFLCLLLSYWIRFYILPGIITLPFRLYVYWGAGLAVLHLITFASFGLYRSFRKQRLYQELLSLFGANLLDIVILMMLLYFIREVHFSRGVLLIFFCLVNIVLGGKRVILRFSLRYYRSRGYNQKHIIILGNSPMARKYFQVIKSDRELGYHPVGYVADDCSWTDLDYLGNYKRLLAILEKYQPDEVVSAITMDDYAITPKIIEACDKTGIKLSIIPFYAEYMSGHPQFDNVDGIPLMNVRRIPLDNWGNAVLKRAMDICGSAVLLILTSPIMLATAIGVKLSSPGPIIFCQSRVGRNKKRFNMYKFRSMRINSEQATGWSKDRDPRKTPFGAFIRKFSIDELPQLVNVLKGDMSLVGPRPEIPFYVDQFKEEIPLYMVKHQVRPGITGWAQVNGFRGDTSIKGRIEHDIYYIENWSIFFDIKILFMTLFKGIMNQEKLH